MSGGEWRDKSGNIWQVDSELGGSCQVYIKTQTIYGHHPDFGKPGVDHYKYAGPYVMSREDVETIFRMLRSCSYEASP